MAFGEGIWFLVILSRKIENLPLLLAFSSSLVKAVSHSVCGSVLSVIQASEK
jgi:hypothetical protein